MHGMVYRLHWDAVTGWMIDVPATLTRSQLQRVVVWSLPRQLDRWRSLPHGDKRTQLGQAIAQLQRGDISQRLIDHDRDGISIPFASTEKATQTTYSF